MGKIYVLISLLFSTAVFAEDKKIVSKNGKFGVVDASGKEIIPIKHYYIFREKDYFVVGDVSLLNKIAFGSGKLNTSFTDILPDFPCISLPPGGAGCNRPSSSSQVRPKSTATFYDLNGKRIGKSEYESKGANQFVKEWLLYRKTNGEGVFVNEKGAEVLFVGAGAVVDSFSDEILIIEKWSGHPSVRRYGLLSHDGKIRTPIKYHAIDKFSKTDGLSRVSVWGIKELNDQKYGFINGNGEEVILPQYTYAAEFSDGMARIFKQKYGEGIPTYIDPSGKELVLNDLFTKEYQEDVEFADGLLAVSDLPYRTNGAKWGYVDKQGKLAIPLQFDYAGKFHDKIAIVGKAKGADHRGKYGVIDTTGRFVIPAVYASMEEFISGASIVYNYRYGLVDRTGKVLAPFIYSNLSRKDFTDHHLEKRIIGTIVTGQRENSYGTFDIKKQCLLSDRGKILIPCKYDFIHEKSGGEFEGTIERNNSHTDLYYFDNNGKYLRKILGQ